MPRLNTPVNLKRGLTKSQQFERAIRRIIVAQATQANLHSIAVDIFISLQSGTGISWTQADALIADIFPDSWEEHQVRLKQLEGR